MPAKICPACFPLISQEHLIKGAQTIGIALTVITLIGGILGILASRGISCGPLNAIANQWGLGVNSGIAGGSFLLLILTLLSCRQTKINVAKFETQAQLFKRLHEEDGKHCPEGCYILRQVTLDQKSGQTALLLTANDGDRFNTPRFSQIYPSVPTPEEEKQFIKQAPSGYFSLERVEEFLKNPSKIQIDTGEYRGILFNTKEKPLSVVFFHLLGADKPDYFASWNKTDCSQIIQTRLAGFIDRNELDDLVKQKISTRDLLPQYDKPEDEFYFTFSLLYKGETVFGTRSKEGFHYANSVENLHVILDKNFPGWNNSSHPHLTL